MMAKSSNHSNNSSTSDEYIIVLKNKDKMLNDSNTIELNVILSLAYQKQIFKILVPVSVIRENSNELFDINEMINNIFSKNDKIISSEYILSYYLNDENANVTPSYCASGYNLLLEQYGAPDICIATNTPVMSAACSKVREYNKYNMIIFSWVHNEIKRYEQSGQGGVSDMLCADYHLVLNNSMEKEIRKAKENAVIFNIGNPIIHTLPDIKQSPASNKLAFIGRLSEEKRIDLILEGLCKAKSVWNLDIVGDGPLVDEVRKWISILKLENRVRLLGWQANPLESITDASFLVSASDYEGFMITGAEALAMGKPVLGTPTQGLTEYVTNSENGYFFDFNDADSLSKLLDDISAGKVPIPDSEKCIRSVERYKKEYYFKNIKKIFLDACKYHL